MSYRIPMVPRYQRVGPDGHDLERVRTLEAVKTDILQGYGYAVVRVEIDQSGETPQVIVWRNKPSDAQKSAVDVLVGTSSHVW